MIKRPLKFAQLPLKPATGRFARSKGDKPTASSHVGVDATKRCFITAGTPSFSASKSRFVEAICTRLAIDKTISDKDPYSTRQKFATALFEVMLFR